jgi:muconate cycloisomerase
MQLLDGAIELPTGPGFGIDVDLAKIDRYRIET